VTIWTVSAVSWLGSLAPWLKQAAEWCTKRSKNLDQQAKDSELTLSQIRAELQELLNARQTPLLIVLDDLDRLSAEQLKAMFQLVKAHMDFANVVFLLLFQRDTVEQGLRRAGFDGADYLEKIIQVPFSVPAISSGQLEAALFGKLDAILANEQQLQQRFDKTYWDQMFQRGMRPFFGNLRHVYRYASTLAFHCRLLRGTEVAEVNAVDLFALECLRVFAPETYADMPRHKALLTNSEQFARQDEPQRTRINQVINQLVNLAPPAHQPATRQLLQEMFPTLDWVFNNTEYDQQIQLRWVINSRVCCDEVFDRYFELSVPEQDVPNSLLHELARCIVDSGAFTTLLTSHEEVRQAEILQRLLGMVDEFPLAQSLAVVQTLLQAGDEVGRRMSFTNWSPRQQIARLLRLFLLRHEHEAARSQLVIEAFAAGPGLVVVEQLDAADYALRRKGDVGYLDDAGLEQLKRAYICTLREVAERDPEAFLAHEDFESYVYDLNCYGEGGDEGRRWSERHITSTTRFLQFAQALVDTRSRYSGDGVTHIDDISLRSLDELLGRQPCADWVAQLDTAELSGDASRTLGLVKEALARHEREATVPASLSPPTISAPLF